MGDLNDGHLFDDSVGRADSSSSCGDVDSLKIYQGEYLPLETIEALRFGFNSKPNFKGESHGYQSHLEST